MRIPIIDLKASGCLIDNDVVTLACLPLILQNIINFLAGAAGIVALFLIVVSGVRLITSQGDPQKLDSARKTLYYALGGLLFIVFSFVILSLIGRITGARQIPH